MVWKKAGKNQYDNDNLKKRIIIQGNTYNKKYDVLLYSPGSRRTLVNYRSKTEALKEAKRYMKKK